MNIRRKLIISTFLSMCAACAETTALENVTLTCGAAAQPQPNSGMLIVDGRIHWIGSASQLKAPAGAQTTDLAGKFVMPGNISLHGHVGNTVDLAQHPKNFTKENVACQLRMYASDGVTSVVSMSSEQPLIMDMRAGQRGPKDLGTLQKGKWADLIVLGASPLDNIKNTRMIEGVWIGENKVK